MIIILVVENRTCQISILLLAKYASYKSEYSLLFEWSSVWRYRGEEVETQNYFCIVSVVRHLNNLSYKAQFYATIEDYFQKD